MTNHPTLPLFYKQPRLMRAAVDEAMSLRQPVGYGFAAGAHAVPLVMGEFAVACRSVPILFAGADAAPIALLGLREGQNLFVRADGRWDEDAYIPAYVRRYPFIFLEDAEADQLTLCVDEAADAVVAGTENPFFVNGAPTDLTLQALDFAREYQASHALTIGFVAALLDSDLLTERRADIALPSGETPSLSGFRVIDEEKLNRLPAETLTHWRDKGWLAAAYAHLISLNDWSALMRRAG
ncbi:SapC family protein [Nitrospirillum sp. BR 11164]|uniref:SapC family protein n=1 Tax=Nitrospirillum sp. BR 11164 TaxID=3104324 RepID=UPI002B003DA2|nr:SapC family protein [Nitrospirillum sp. BR 11164]MEA1648824.1 SapC family protein [Nitrospirillum sp. BR 11164]